MVRNYINWCADILLILVGVFVVVMTSGYGIGFVATSRIFFAFPAALLTGFIGIAAGILIAVIGFKRINKRF